MYLDRLEIRNLKAIRKAVISFSYTENSKFTFGSNITVLLGNNGTGKTTILAGIALSILAPIIKNSGYFARHMVTFGEGFGVVESSLLCHTLDFSETNEAPPNRLLETKLELEVRGEHTNFHWNNKAPIASDPFEKIYEDDNPAFFLLGYGATRRVDRSDDASAREKSRSVRYQRVAGLFEDHYALVPVESWFPKLAGKRRQKIGEMFDDLLPEELVFTGSQNTNFWFEHHGVKMPFEALSDGYRAYVGLVSDILYHLSQVTRNELRDIKGIILIDEIDLHLHPIWQREVLERLTRNLPNVQFIVTSHSAIVAGSVPDKALLVLHREDDGEISADRPKQSIFGLSADQILVSDHFGLATTRAPGPALKLREMSRAAMKGQKSGNLDASIEYLKMVAAHNDQPFDNQSDSIERNDISPKTRVGRGWFYNMLIRFANRFDQRNSSSKLVISAGIFCGFVFYGLFARYGFDVGVEVIKMVKTVFSND